jgi:hypothetical protein
MLTQGPTDIGKGACRRSLGVLEGGILEKKVIIFGGRAVERTPDSFAICRYSRRVGGSRRGLS